MQWILVLLVGIALMVAFDCSSVVEEAASKTMSEWRHVSEQRQWCNGTKNNLLKLDEACVHISSSEDVQLLYKSEECYLCPFQPLIIISRGSSEAVIVNSDYASQLLFRTEDNYDLCNYTYHFGEYGVYKVNVNGNKCEDVVEIEEAAFIYWPVIFAFLVYLFIIVTWKLFRLCYERHELRRRMNRLYFWGTWDNFINDLGNPEEDTASVVTAQTTEAPPARKQRLHSLDTFRGISIFLMIFVNYGGGKLWLFRHSPWNGLTIADIVFPWFMWIMGVSLVISLNSALRRAVTRSTLLFKVLRRCALLFLIGLILNSHGRISDIHKLRIPGVLQRFALVYFIVAVMEVLIVNRDDPYQARWWSGVRDLVYCWAQWLIVLILAAVHAAITFALPFPGCPTGYLGPGGMHSNGSFWNCTGGAAQRIDVMLFGKQHIYSHPTSRRVYGGDASYDPEGLLGTLNSVLVVYLGVQAGKIILLYKLPAPRLRRWVWWGVLTGLAAGVLCKFSKEDGWIPINKNLWSLSFCLALSSLAFFFLALIYFLQDTLHWWDGSPFRYAGMNALLLYVGHELCNGVFPWIIKPLPQTHMAHVAVNAWGATLWMFIAYACYKKDVFISL